MTATANTALTVLLFVVLFSIGFFMFQWATAAAKTQNPASSMYRVENRIPANVNAASTTTQQRKQQTLNNPVGMLNGQQVYLKVSTNPPR